MEQILGITTSDATFYIAVILAAFVLLVIVQKQVRQ